MPLFAISRSRTRDPSAERAAARHRGRRDTGQQCRYLSARTAFLEMVVLGTTSQLAAFCATRFTSARCVQSATRLLYERVGRITSWPTALLPGICFLPIGLRWSRVPTSGSDALAPLSVVVQQLFDNRDARTSNSHVDTTARRLLLNTVQARWCYLPRSVPASPISP